MHPREVLTAEDMRTVGFQPVRASEEMDGSTAHVYHEVTHGGDRWTAGLGVFLAGADPAAADAYWADLMREAEQPDTGWERPAVGDRAVVSDGWLYLRWQGHVLWTFAEGPDPSLARRACEQFARIVCGRIDATTRWLAPARSTAGGRPDPPPAPLAGSAKPAADPRAGVRACDPAGPRRTHSGPARRPVAWPALIFAFALTAVAVAAVLGAGWIVLTGLGGMAAVAGTIALARGRRRARPDRTGVDGGTEGPS